VCKAPSALNHLVTSKQVIRQLKREGWYEVRHVGNHKQFKHDVKPGLVTVPIHGKKELPKGTYASIAKQAGWD
jgi:predicted RNA binding protein YcfA (HicA-like mRNA interferase family)